MLAEEDKEQESENVWQYPYDVVVSRRHSEFLDEGLAAASCKAEEKTCAKCRKDRPVPEYECRDREIAESQIDIR